MTAHAGYRALAWIVTALVVIASTATTGQATAAEPATTADAGTGAVDWVDCGDGLQCGFVEVPLDYAEPGAATIQVALTRRPATGGDSRGFVVVNAGTQAGGGGAFVRNFPAAFTEVGQDFDVVGLDTRGVGHSQPLVQCTTHEENRQIEPPPSAAQTVADRDTRLAEATELAARCQQRSGDLLPHLSSTTSARDLDRVRAALGEQRLRFIGFSGGAVLGQQYLAMFPGRVAAMVLDSPFDARQFTQDAFEFDVDQMVATERTMGTFFRWCKDTPSACPFGGNDPRAAFEALLAKTRQNRIDHPDRWDIVTDGALIDFISGGMLFPAQWPGLGQQLAAMAADPLPTRPLPSGDDRAFAEYYSQTCLDRDFPHALPAYDQQLHRSLRATDYLGGRYGYAELKCRQWPAEAAEHRGGPWLNPGHRPVLVLAATDDPLAPRQGAVELAHRLRAGLVVLDASGHLQLGRTPCADGPASEFLRTGASPRFTACSVPLPSQ